MKKGKSLAEAAHGGRYGGCLICAERDFDQFLTLRQRGITKKELSECIQKWDCAAETRSWMEKEELIEIAAKAHKNFRDRELERVQGFFVGPRGDWGSWISLEDLSKALPENSGLLALLYEAHETGKSIVFEPRKLLSKELEDPKRSGISIL